MVMVGGVGTSILLLIVVFATTCFHFRTPRVLKASALFNTALWVSIVAILGVAVYVTMKAFTSG